MLLFSTRGAPASSRALEASRGRFVRTTEAAIVRGASVGESESIVRSPGDWDMLAGWVVRLRVLF